MTTTPPLTTSAATPIPSTITASHRPALLLLFAVFVTALVGRTVFLLWEPPFTGAIEYDTVTSFGDAYGAMNLFVGGPSFALTWVTLALFVALLARGRSTAVTLAAAVLIGCGGLLFALAIVAEIYPFVAAAGSSSSEADGRVIFDTLNSGLGSLTPTVLGAQAVIAVGVLVALVVSLVTRVLPRAVAIAGVVYFVVFFAVPFAEISRVAVIASDLVLTLLVGTIGWFGLRAGLGLAAQRGSAARR